MTQPVSSEEWEPTDEELERYEAWHEREGIEVISTNERAVLESRITTLTEMVRERDRALEAIIIRCEEGDKRSDWLPTIASIAKHALEPKLVS